MGHSATYFRNAGTSSIFLLDELKKKKKKLLSASLQAATSCIVRFEMSSGNVREDTRDLKRGFNEINKAKSFCLSKKKKKNLPCHLF